MNTHERNKVYVFGNTHSTGGCDQSVNILDSRSSSIQEGIKNSPKKKNRNGWEGENNYGNARMINRKKWSCRKCL